VARVFITRRFQRSYESLDPPVQKRVHRALDRIQENPRRGRALIGPLAGEYAFRVGAYRVIYRYQAGDELVWVLTVRHRSDVYRKRKGG